MQQTKLQANTTKDIDYSI